MKQRSNSRSCGLRLAGIVLAGLLAAACSSSTDAQVVADAAAEEDIVVDEGSDTGDGVSVDEEAGAEDASSEESAGDVEQLTSDECIELMMQRGAYSTAAGALERFGTETDEVTLSTDQVAAARAAIDLYAPFQDVVPEVFSPMREGIENLTTDLDAYEAGTFTGATGEYGVVNIVPALAELGC